MSLQQKGNIALIQVQDNGSGIPEEVQPKVFIAENVKGLTVGDSAHLLGNNQLGMFGQHEDTIFYKLVSAGYNVRYKVLNAKHYGVPQSRERTIFIGVRKDINIKISYPIDSGKKPVTLGQAFEGLTHSPDELNECDIDKYFSLVKQRKNRYADTLTQSAGNISAASIAHWDNRKFTVKEAIRIMSFPDDYYLGDNYKQKIERLGRAVPPLMMKAVAEHVYKTILKQVNDK